MKYSTHMHTHTHARARTHTTHTHTQSFAIVGQVQFIQDGSLRQLFTIIYIIVIGYYWVIYKTDYMHNTSVKYCRKYYKTSQNQDTTLL